MLMRFDPFREFDRLAQAMLQQAGAVRSLGMPMDAYRDKDRLIVHFDLPGVDPGSIDVTLEQNILTVRAERRWGAAEGQEVVVSERPQGTFTRQLFLGESLDTDHIDARFEQGVLTVTIPVAEQAKARRVEVTSGTAGATAIEAGPAPSEQREPTAA
jgi:HSP20 family protein